MDRFNFAEIFGAVAAGTKSAADATAQLKRLHIVEVQVDGIDQQFLDHIVAEGRDSLSSFMLALFDGLSPALG